MVTESTQQEYSARHVHQTLGGTTTFWRDFTLAELGIFALPLLVGGLLLGLPFVPAAALVPILVGTAVIEVSLWTLHRVRPPHLRLTEWLGIRALWAAKRREATHGHNKTDTRNVTRLADVHPFGVERVDGAYVAAVRVRPANMALEDEASWQDAVQSLADLANSTLDFDVRFYITTREVDNAAFVRAHERRLDDPDVQQRPILRELIERFVDANTDRDGTIAREAAALREYYVIVTVTDADIAALDRTEYGVRARLGGLPLVGRALGSDGGRLSAAERDALKRKKLEQRLSAVRRGINGLYRCTSDPVDGYELTQLVKEYWSCQSESYADIETAVGSFPVWSHAYAEGVSTPSERSTATNEDSGGDGTETEIETETDIETDATSRVTESSASLDSVRDGIQGFVVPSTIDWEPAHARLNERTVARTFWIEQFPEHPEDGFLERVLLDTDLQPDITVDIQPYDSRSAVDAIGDWISTLRATMVDVDALRAEDLQDEIDRATHIRRLVRKNKTGLYRTGVFLRLTASDEEELDRKTTKLEAIIRDAPANCTIKPVLRRPEAGLATVSPIGWNELGDDRCSTMTGEAVGALFPFSSNYLRMPEGVAYGAHGHNESAIHIDPWDLETGHSELVTGMPGSGKTHGAQARSLRMAKRRDDVLQVIIDPVGDMRGSATALDAKHITVSGRTPLNPCEMHPTPEHILEKSRDMEPLAAKKDEVYGVVENFLASREIELEMHSGVVSFVIDTIYARSPIDPEDPTTHTPENSPTMRDFLTILDDIAEHPGRYDIADSEAVQERVADYAAELAIALQPFREGSTYANLSKRSDLDVLEGDHSVVYIDLQQVEGTSDGLGKQSFIMQLLLGTVYQQAKRTEKLVEVVIDEAHYLFEDTANLAFLNQIARHQRHAGMRLVFLSQTLQEFYDGSIAEEIAGMCPIKIHHREPGLDAETAAKAGLTEDQRWFIQSAEAGKESTGYSEALVRVDEHGDYPINIVTSEIEKLVIEYDPDDRAVLDSIIDAESSARVRMQSMLDDAAVRSTLTAEYDLSETVMEEVLDADLTDSELVDGVYRALAARAERDTSASAGADDD